MKRFLAIILSMIMVFSLSACSTNSNDDANLQIEFLKFLNEEFSSDGNSIQTPNLKLDVREIEVNFEKAEYDKKIIVTMGSPYEDEQFFNLSLEQLKIEMCNFAEHFISFAKEINLDNDYYLYVEVYYTPYWGFVYDYEEDRLYYPENYDLLLKARQKFGTVNQSRIAEETEGQNWLVENGFGEFKHHEYESYYNLHHPWVYISDDGEFSSFRLNDYI